jgi:hypothetical protein
MARLRLAVLGTEYSVLRLRAKYPVPSIKYMEITQ